MAAGGVTRALDWNQFEAMCGRLASQLADADIDLVVGIARGGLPFAVRLSHALGAGGFGVLYLRQTASNAAFDLDITAPVSNEGALLPEGGYKRVLIIDDIVTVGIVMKEAERLVRRQYGDDIDVVLASGYADLTQISAGPVPDLAGRLIADADIDNTTIWIEFPWELGSGTSAA